MIWGVMVGGRRPLVEDNLRWKTTFDGRLPLVENDLWWNMTFGGRRPLVEGDLTLVEEDNLRWKTTFCRRWLGWTVPHSDFLIDTKNIETQKIVGSKLYELYFSPACCLVHFVAFFGFRLIILKVTILKQNRDKYLRLAYITIFDHFRLKNILDNHDTQS